MLDNILALVSDDDDDLPYTYLRHSLPHAEAPGEVAERGNAAGGVQRYKRQADGAVGPPGDAAFFSCLVILSRFIVWQEPSK